MVSISSYSQEVKGEMICKVKSNYVVSIEEGTTEVFSGFKDSFNKGDSLVFSFNINKDVASIELTHKDDIFTSYYISEAGTKDLELLGDDGFKFKGFPVIPAFRSNWIYIETYSLGSLRLKRYYKGDWNGFLTRSFIPSSTEQITTLDCRQSSDRVDDFIGAVRKLVNKL